MTLAYLTGFTHRAMDNLLWGYNQAKEYLQFNPPKANIEWTMTVDGVKHVLSGRAKELAIEQASLINRADQLRRVNNAASSVLGVFGYHKGLWNNSLCMTLLAFPFAYGVNKLASMAIEKYIRPKSDELYVQMRGLIGQPVAAPKAD
ncbi:MAG: hypothetical protein K1X28_07755 [Parachlamydiales bacterium]|nr:hypothetical protein [Parachlamydiales bacterium]